MDEADRTETVGAEVQPPFWPERRLAPGTSIGGRYEVLSVLGQGGSATVYLVHDRELNCQVALKMLRPERHTEAALLRLRREVAVARAASSPHLVRVFDIGTANQGVYLTMEVMAGSLRERLGPGSGHEELPVAEAIRIGIQLLDGLAALHALGVVHRDVKPANVLLSATGDVKLADFGLARYLDRKLTRATVERGVLGTIDYLSPEQALAKPMDARSDLYSAGLVLFEMLAGHLPFSAKSDLGMFIENLRQPAPSVRRARPQAPPWLAAVIGRLLEKNPASRYPDAVQAAADLRRQRAAVRLRRLTMRALAAAALAAVGGVLFFLRPLKEPVPPFSHLVQLQDGFAAIDTHGRTLWTMHGYDPEIFDHHAMARLEAGKPRLIAAVLQKPGQWRPDQVSTLSYIDPMTGRIVNQAQLPRASEIFPHDPQRFSANRVAAVDLDGDGIDEIVVSYENVPEAPSFCVLYAPRYSFSEIVFYSRGGHHFEGAWDIDGDGRPELIFAGINNAYDWVNMVAAVHLDPWVSGSGRLVASSSAASPDSIEYPAQEEHLLWYAPLPRGGLPDNGRVTADPQARMLAVHYQSGRIWQLTYDGFPPAPPGRLPPAQRQSPASRGLPAVARSGAPARSGLVR